MVLYKECFVCPPTTWLHHLPVWWYGGGIAPGGTCEGGVQRRSLLELLVSMTTNKTIPLDPVAKAERLENDDTIATLHDQATSSETNATSRGNIDDDLITHFIALIHKDGRLYELDGRKEAPVDHGPTTELDLLTDSIRVVQQYMQRDPTEVRFTILALAPKQE
jgi:hypothetical protein